MSIFDGLERLDQKKKPEGERGSIFDGLERLDDGAQDLSDSASATQQEQTSPQNTGFWEDTARYGAREILKPALEGAASIADLPSAAYNLVGAGVKWGFDKDIGEAPYPSEYVGKGVDWATGGYSKGQPGVVGSAIKGGVSMVVPGGLASKAAAKGAQLGSKALTRTGKALNYTGSTKAPAVAGGAVANVVADEMHKDGAGGLNAFGASMAADLATQAVGTALSRKPILKAAGLGPKNLKLDAINAAERQELDLPAWSATDAKSMKLGAQIGSHTPFVGDKMQKQGVLFGEKFMERVDDLANKIGPEYDKGKIDALYDRSRSFLPESATIVPEHTADVLRQIEQEIAKKGMKSPKTKEILAEIQSYKKNIGIGEFEGKHFVPPHPVSHLVETKKELNSIIKWDQKSDLPTKYFKDIRKAVSKDIETYGQSDEKFLNAFNKANEYRTRVGRREDFEGRVRAKIGNEKDGVKYTSFVKIAEDRTKKDVLRKMIGSENMKDYEDLVKVARAMKEGAKVPNPSGTGPAKTLYEGGLKLISLITTGAIFNINPAAGAASISVPLYAKRILTNPKILKQAKAFAEKGDEVYLKRMAGHIKASTGMSIEKLAKELGEAMFQKNT